MPAKLWAPAGASTSEFELVVCAAAKTMLTVVVVGPRPEPERAPGEEMPYMRVSVLDGRVLDFLGLSASGSKRHSVYVGEFELPDTSQPLRVRLERYGTEAFSETAIAVPM
jgi:hypothetical protein